MPEMTEPRKLGLACKEVELGLGIVARDYPEVAEVIRKELQLRFGKTRAVERMCILLRTPAGPAPKAFDTSVANQQAFITNPNPHPHPEWVAGTKLRPKGGISKNIYVATSGGFISRKDVHDWRIRCRDQDGIMENEFWVSMSKLELVPDVPATQPLASTNGATSVNQEPRSS